MYLMQHVELYVNDWTLDLGKDGQLALDALSARAHRIGILPPGADRLQVSLRQTYDRNEADGVFLTRSVSEP